VRHPPAEARVARRIAQKVDDLRQLGFGLVDACHVSERDGDALSIDEACARAAEGAERAHPAAGPRHRAKAPDQEADEEDRRSEAEQQLDEDRLPARARLDLDVLSLELGGELGIAPERRNLGREERGCGRRLRGRRVTELVLEVALNRVGGGADRADLTGVQVAEESAERDRDARLTGWRGEEQ
jgi:hypothetical protein